MPIVCYCNISDPEFIYLNNLNSLVNSSSASTDIDALGNNSHCSILITHLFFKTCLEPTLLHSHFN